MKLDPRNGINGLVLYFVQCITRGDWKAVEIAYSQWISTENELHSLREIHKRKMIKKCRVKIQFHQLDK